MKIILAALCLAFYTTASHAQETVELNMKLTREFTATYHVLKSDMKTLDGLYQVKHGKNLALASGLYANGKKIGLWHFFNNKGVLVQNYDYDKNALTYEAPDEPGINGFKYHFDYTVKEHDEASKPMKVGGRYYGYLPLLTVFQKPTGIDFGYSDVVYVTLELLISPGGRLADYNVHISDSYDVKNYNINLDLLKEEDRIFIPATFNHEPAACTITIPCTMNRRGELTIL